MSKKIEIILTHGSNTSIGQELSPFDTEPYSITSDRAESIDADRHPLTRSERRKLKREKKN